MTAEIARLLSLECRKVRLDLRILAELAFNIIIEADQLLNEQSAIIVHPLLVNEIDLLE